MITRLAVSIVSCIFGAAPGKQSLGSKRLKHRINRGLMVGMACLGLRAGQSVLANKEVINVLDQGAVADGTALNTAALQKAIAVCSEQGGGTVLIPPGIYRTGPIQLRSHVTLQLEAGAVLRTSEAIEDHRLGGRLRPLIWAENATNIAICVTSVESRKPGVCENVTVNNCTLSSRSAGIRIGYGWNTIRNCVFENLVIRNSNRRVGLFVRQEGSIENVLFNNLIIQTRLHTGHWWGKGEPIHISVLPERKSNTELGRVRNVVFANILAESESGVVIWAQEPGRIEDVTLDRVRLRLRQGPLSESCGGNIDLRPVFDPQWALFRHDLAGVFCHGASGLTLNQIEVRWDADAPDYHAHAIWCEETSRLVIDGFRGRQPGSGDGRAAIRLDAVRGIIVRNSQAAEGTTIFLAHRGVTEAGLFGNNDVTQAATAIAPPPSPFTSSPSPSSPAAPP